MSGNHQLIVALAQERHSARYESEGSTGHGAGGSRAVGFRARAGWALVSIGLRLAVSGDRARTTALLGR